MALGMAFGIFTGMMPIMPFQMVLSVALALVFKASKITAALGTWISNPVNWYFLYYYSYKLGSSILGMEKYGAMFNTIMEMVRSGEESMVIVQKILASGGLMAAAFLMGGLIMGILAALPSYFVFLFIFKRIREWRKAAKR